MHFMTDADAYGLCAEECHRRAADATSPAEKAKYLDLAEQYESLAARNR